MWAWNPGQSCYNKARKISYVGSRYLLDNLRLEIRSSQVLSAYLGPTFQCNCSSEYPDIQYHSFTLPSHLVILPISKPSIRGTSTRNPASSTYSALQRSRGHLNFSIFPVVSCQPVPAPLPLIWFLPYERLQKE